MTLAHSTGTRSSGSRRGGVVPNGLQQQVDGQTRRAAQSVVDVVAKQTGFRPTDVSCPSGVEAKVGRQFDCRFTRPEGKPYTAHLRVTKVDGEAVLFDVNSRPS
jgi:hypothetical protein